MIIVECYMDKYGCVHMNPKSVELDERIRQRLRKQGLKSHTDTLVFAQGDNAEELMDLYVPPRKRKEVRDGYIVNFRMEWVRVRMPRGARHRGHASVTIDSSDTCETV